MSTHPAIESIAEIEIPLLAESPDLFPAYSSEEAAGADVRANLSEPMTIAPGSSALVPTGLRCEIPVGYEIQVRPRSGLALKSQVTVLNSPGTIDSDYRGEIKIILINHGRQPFIIEPKMRIAQLIIAPVIRARFLQADQLNDSARGAGGFGHTGTR